MVTLSPCFRWNMYGDGLSLRSSAYSARGFPDTLNVNLRDSTTWNMSPSYM